MELKIILIFLFSGICVGLYLFLLFYFIFSRKKNLKENYDSILFFLEIDLKNWRIRRYNNSLNKKLLKQDNKLIQKFIKNIKYGWIDLSVFFDKLDDEQECKWKKSIEFCIQNKMNYSFGQKIEFKSRKNGKQIYFFEIKFRYVGNQNVIVEYKIKDKSNNNYYADKCISKEDIFKNKDQYNLFIAFSLIDTNFETINKFVNKMYLAIPIKDLFYFKINSMLIFYYSNKNYKNIKKTKQKIKNTINHPKYLLNFGIFFDGMSYVESNEIVKEKDFSKIMTRISFSLMKSKLSKSEAHFNLNNIQFNEFEEFKEKMNELNNLIESKELDYKTYSVNEISNQNEVYNFILPKFKIENDYWTNDILKINNFNKKINDKFASEIISKKINPEKDTLICVNDYFIEKNYEMIPKLTNYIFIIHQSKFKNFVEFSNFLKLLEISEIRYGIFVEEFTKDSLSLLINNKPEVVILFEKLNHSIIDNVIKEKLDIINFIILTEKMNINLIFSNIDDDSINKIKLVSKKSKYYINADIFNLFLN